MPSRHWFRGAPDTPGWYLWRRSQVMHNPAKWEAWYIRNGKVWDGYWEQSLPRGGWWSLICEDEGESE